jgi:hypothetical protein
MDGPGRRTRRQGAREHRARDGARALIAVGLWPLLTGCGGDADGAAQPLGAAPAATAAAATSPATAPRPPAPPPPPAAASDAFFAAYLARPPAERDAGSLQQLLVQFEEAVFARVPPPAGFPTAAVVERDLRTAVATIDGQWQAFFEYTVATHACQTGDVEAMRRAAEGLAALAARLPDLQDYAVPRQTLLADLRRALGDSSTALALVDALLENPAVRADPATHSRVLGIRGEVLRETGRLDDATEQTDLALERAHASGDPSAIEQALLRSFALALVTGRFVKVRDAIQQALADLPAEQRGTRAMLLVFRGYAEAGLADGDADWLATASATLAQARDLAAGHLRMRADMKRLDLALRAHDLDGAAAALADCEQSLGAPAATGFVSRDEGEIEGLRTLLLLRTGAGPDALRLAHGRLRRAVESLAEEWRRHPPERGGIGFLHLGDRRELLATAIELELALATAEGRADGPNRALQILLDLQAEASLARARGARRTTVAALQKDMLQAGHGAMVYLPCRRLTWVLAVDGELVHAFELPPARDVLHVCRQANALLVRPPNATGPERTSRNGALETALNGAALVLLPAPVRTWLEPLRALTVVGADLLDGLPLDTLPLADGRLLGEVLAIDHTGSLPFVAMVAAQRRAAPPKPPPLRLLLLGCTSPSDQVGGAAERFAFPLEELAPGLEPFDATVRVDAKATRRALLDAPLRDYDVVHLVAHHDSGSAEAPESGLLLHDGRVSRTDLVGRQVRGLVVVSACGGGQGPVRCGEGEAFASLAGAFLWNGADAILAAGVDLLALDHLRLLRHVHAALAQGASPARALQQARAALAPGSDLLARTQRTAVQVFGAGQWPLRR